MDTTTPQAETEAPDARTRWEHAEEILTAAADNLKRRNGIDYHADIYRSLSRRHEAGCHRAVREVTGVPRSEPAPSLDTLTDEERARAGERAVELMRQGAVRVIHDFGFCGSGVNGFLHQIGQPSLERKDVWVTSVSIGGTFHDAWDRDGSADTHARVMRRRIEEKLPEIRELLDTVPGFNGHAGDITVTVSAYADQAYV